MQTIVNAVTEYDRKQSRKSGYNHYALAHYLRAAGDVDRHVAAGIPLRSAIIGCFNGRLADTILRACGLEIMTTLEARYGVRLPELAEVE